MPAEHHTTLTPDTPVRYLKGVGPKTAERFEKLGTSRVWYALKRGSRLHVPPPERSATRYTSNRIPASGSSPSNTARTVKGFAGSAARAAV